MNIIHRIARLSKPLLLVALWLLPLLLVFNFRLVASYNYDNDFGRDLVDMHAITQGDITLLGPKLSFGGLHTGPYYYYVFAPVLALFPGQPEAILYAHAFLTWLALVLTGVVWLKLERWKLPVTIASLYWIGLSSYFLYSARGPGNAFSYVGWLVLLLALYPQVWKRTSWWLWGLYGLGWGIVVNFHLAVLFVAFPLLGMLGLSTHLSKSRFSLTNWRLTLGLIIGFIASFAPLMLFELTHNFVMIRNTFIDKSYQIFLENGNLPAALQTSTNPIINYWLFLNHTLPWVTPSILWLTLAIVVILGIKKVKIPAHTISLSISFIVSTVLVALVASSQLVYHYLFPFIALSQVAVLYVVKQAKYTSNVIIILPLVALLSFPIQWYQTSKRPLRDFRLAADEIASSLNDLLKQYSFQVYVTREISTAPIGYEYRYFLRTKGLISDPPHAFNSSQYILWFAEQPLVNIENVTSWELEQFGPRMLLDTQIVGTRTVYLFGRQR